MKIEEIHQQEVQYILSNALNLEYRKLSYIKLLFTKRYSVRFIDKIKKILNRKFYLLLSFFSSDDFEYLSEDTSEFYYIDKMSFYRLTIDENRYYLLYSIVYDKEQPGIKKESVEIFHKK